MLEIRIFPDGGLSRLGLYREKEVQALVAGLGSQRGLDTHDVELFPGAGLDALHDFLRSSEQSLALRYKMTFGPGAEPPSSEDQEVRERIAVRKAAPVPVRLLEQNGNPPCENVASQLCGAKVLWASNEHYGPATSVVAPYPPLGMFDGFETKRSRPKGGVPHCEEVHVCVSRAGARLVSRVGLDFTWFVNNNPFEVEVLGAQLDSATAETHREHFTIPLIPRFFSKPYKGNVWMGKVAVPKLVTHVCVRLWPDGGINRVVVA